MGIFNFFRKRGPETPEPPSPGPGEHMAVFGGLGMH
jgi:hypothetical protein